MYILMIVVFVLGYAAIALEHKIKIDKAATALMLGALMWMLFIFGKDSILGRQGEDGLLENKPWSEYLASHPEAQDGGEKLEEVKNKFLFEVQSLHHLGETSETLFFLLCAMTIVAIIDRHNGFSIITEKIKTRSKRKLLWILSAISFIMSAVLDNLTTTIVMVTLLNKLVSDRHQRWLFAGAIVLAANAGGAWSPIGDVTTIMLWIGEQVTAGKIVVSLILPSIISLFVPILLLSIQMKGELEQVQSTQLIPDPAERGLQKLCLNWGIVSLISVPILKIVLHLPPYMGMILALGLFWLLTDVIHHRRGDHKQNSVIEVLTKVDTSTILFFLGILSAVAALQTTGHLQAMSQMLDSAFNKNIYGIGISIGLLSSIVDNVPLVAGAMGMYEIGASPELVQDGAFWHFLAYVAGTGGSILIIGSAAGVAAMGLEKIDFGWYLKHISWLALLGYLAGAGCFWLIESLLF